ncbi:E3 ubiquitin-protein ligase ZNF598 [Gryllus bimaculatus]|nr:E3 ubiquitin-protein ligase ZNF598 [Gryllus bimaculatus]
MSSTVLSENTENTCVVCFKNVSIYSIGECDHPVCYECSTRMRVLCRQNECPICRQDMPKVIFTKNVQPFKNIKNNTYLMDKKFKICFDNAEIQSAYSKLLEHVCTICPGRPAFRTFQNLKDHMRKEHELHYCDLCVDNLKIFTGERRCYTRQELAQHRRKGDPDDRSHRGHPLCEFCDQRYMDNDELFRHLRRDHLFCHFCDADGFHRYYSSYDYLRDHFRADHFLCEEGSCMDEKFTSAFRSEIDLKAHRASVHGRTMGKAAAKQARTLELEFTLAPRPRPERGGGGGGGGGRPGQPGGRRATTITTCWRAAPRTTTSPAPAPRPAALAAAAPRHALPRRVPHAERRAGPARARGLRPNGVAASPSAPCASRARRTTRTSRRWRADRGPAARRPQPVRLSVNSERAGDGLSIRVNRRADPPRPARSPRLPRWARRRPSRRGPPPPRPSPRASGCT